MTDKIEKLIGTMSADQIDELEAAINSIKQKKNPPPSEGKPRKNRRKPRKNKGSPVQPTQKKRIITQETENMNQGRPAPRKKGKRAPERTQGSRRGSKRRATGGSPCRVEPIAVQGERPNLFLSSKLKNKHKADKSIDQKLAGNNEITEREPIRLIEVECVDCHYIFDVSPKVVFMENGEVRYRCDDCQQEHSSRIGSERTR